MNVSNLLTIALFFVLLSVFSSCSSSKGFATYSKDTTTWPEKTSGTLGFNAESPLYKADANFRKWVFAKLSIPNNDILELKATILVDINSVYEQTIRLTQDLKTELYLDGKNYPLATAVISDVVLVEGDNYKATVELSLKKVTKKLEATFVLSKENGKFHVKGEIQLMRKDFDVGNDEMKSIKNEVLIYFDTDLG